MNAVVSSGVGALVPQTMDQAVRLAEMMARGKMLPAHLQNSPGDCLMVVEQAMRWRMSPFAVAQCTASIKGKLMYEGKLVAAAIESSGAIIGGFDYQFSGAGQDRKIIVSATRTGETAPRTVEVVLRDAVTDNGIWRKQPDQQLVYHGTRVWGRRWTPSVILGVYSREEFDGSGRTVDDFDGPTIEATAEVATPKEPPPKAPTEPPKRTIAEFLEALAIDLNAAQTADDVDTIVARDDVQRGLDTFRNGALERLKAMIREAQDRTADEPTQMET